MLDGLLGRGFASKCKSLIKLTKSQIDVIRRKRNATLKFLKTDMAELLSNGLDVNAYGRAEGPLAELTLSSSYDLVEQYCDFVLKHLSVMQKMSHCPEDCREAVSSLMLAAARFSDLPMLRDLRHIFLERYGNSLDLFANQKFVENLSSKPFTMEQKVWLMQDIASEFSIKWDSRCFKQRMSKPPSVAQGKQKMYGSLPTNDDKCMSVKDKDTKGDKHKVLSKQLFEHANVAHRVLNNKEDHFSRGNKLDPAHLDSCNGYKKASFKEKDVLHRNKQDILFQAKQEASMQKHESLKDDASLKAIRLGTSSQRKKMESIDGGFKLPNGGENTVAGRDGQDIFTCGNSNTLSSYGGLLSKNDCNSSVAGNRYGVQHINANSTRNVHEEMVRDLQPHNKNFIPPPYMKPNSQLKDGKYGAKLGSYPTGSDGNVVLNDPLNNNRVTLSNCSEKTREGSCHENINYYQDEGMSNPISKSKSSRRRHPKSLSSYNDTGNLEDAGVVKRRLRSRRRDNSKRGPQILFDDEHNQVDEEERMIDKLLIHYSKKPSAYEADEGRRKPKTCHGHHQGTKVVKSPQHISGVGTDDISEKVAPPRSVSLPHEHTTSGAAKLFMRAASLQPGRSSPARHVHPNLPDYDDLAAQFAALKGS
uniref:Uncharacterized protein MANES_03G020000 n=2 Tax=Rhizophora mucronata TaxID=61149 RepID=A0A2P2J8A8_RHIMU